MLACPGTAAAQEPASLVPAEVSAQRVTLEGLVLGLDGLPEEGALVVTDAGGKATTDAAGRYRLDVRVPAAASVLRVTAIGSGGTGRLASAGIARHGGSNLRPDPLRLALGSTCSPRWLPTFGGIPGTNRQINALAVFDDGGGPALFVGGNFTQAGAAQAGNVARWDGTSWSALGLGVDLSVRALAVFDDGSGPALYVGGNFRSAGGMPADRIARWDGTTWSTVGGGFSGGLGGLTSVEAMLVHDDGSGPALHAAGEFTQAGPTPAKRVARWNGVTWSALGGGLDGTFTASDPTVFALAAFDDGGGPVLFAGGGFRRADGVGGKNGIARWNGSAWQGVGSGMDAAVRSLAAFDDGSGPALFAGGLFTSAGGNPAGHVARWDGASWTEVGGGTSDAVRALSVFDDGGGPALIAGGAFATAGGVTVDGLARWDGAAWGSVGGGVTGGSSSFPPVLALTTFDDGGGPVLLAGGYLSGAGGVDANHVARWDGVAWSALGGGLNRPVAALLVFDDGSGPALYAGGTFTSIDGLHLGGIGRWDGTAWSGLAGGVAGDLDPSSPTPGVLALAVFDDGGGPALYAAGNFLAAGGVPANAIARWDGASWSALGTGLTGMTSSASGVYALAVHDDGGGPALYAAGAFTAAGGLPASRIAKWDGAQWQPLGTGLGGFAFSLASHDDGSGAELYVGGSFGFAGGIAASAVARWNGSQWAPLGAGVSQSFFSPTVRALHVFDDGTGPALYVGGTFDAAGGVSAFGLARWQSATWSAVSGSAAQTYALGTFEDGSGPALLAAGVHQGGVSLARWDGTGWSVLGQPVPQDLGGSYPNALAVFDDGSGPALYMAGPSDAGDYYLSKWGLPDDLEAPTIACPLSVEVVDATGSPSGETVDFVVTASDCRDPAPAVVCVPPSGSFFPRGTTLVTCTATDAAGNQSACQFPVTVLPKARRR